jgi:hypothetical protein
MADDAVSAAAANADITEAPRPLMRELPPADPYPTDVLGLVLGDAAIAIHDRTQAPLAICAQSVLAAATLAVQGHADVMLPTAQHRPVSEDFLTVAQSGERKSAADGEALRPVRKREAALREQYNNDLPSYRNAEAAWSKARDFAIKKAKGNRSEIKHELDAIGPAPAPPLVPMLTCAEPTLEGLAKLFGIGQPSLGIFSGEGGQFIGGHAMSDERKLASATGLSRLWDGDPLDRVRSLDGATIMPGRRLTMHLMVQPGVAAVMLSDPMLLDQGLLSRMLVTAPAPASGNRFWHEPAPESEGKLRRYNGRLLDILEAPLPLSEGKTNELTPRYLPLAAASRRAWISFADHIERQIGPDGALAPVRGLANKLPEHAARLAAVLALVANLDAGEISADPMAAGIALAQHYAAEALRLFEVGKVSADLMLAQKLLNWIQGEWAEPAISLPDIYQLGPNAVRDAGTARKLVDILEEHGWLKKSRVPMVVANQKRRDAWVIVRGEA